MEQEQLQQLESKLAVLEAGSEIFGVLKEVLARVERLEDVLRAQFQAMQKLGIAVSAHETFFELMRSQSDGKVQ